MARQLERDIDHGEAGTEQDDQFILPEDFVERIRRAQGSGTKIVVS